MYNFEKWYMFSSVMVMHYSRLFEGRNILSKLLHILGKIYILLNIKNNPVTRRKWCFHELQAFDNCYYHSSYNTSNKYAYENVKIRVSGRVILSDFYLHIEHDIITIIRLYNSSCWKWNKTYSCECAKYTWKS